MICKSCGKEFDGQPRFCPFCGANTGVQSAVSGDASATAGFDLTKSGPTLNYLNKVFEHYRHLTPYFGKIASLEAKKASIPVPRKSGGAIAMIAVGGYVFLMAVLCFFLSAKIARLLSLSLGVGLAAVGAVLFFIGLSRNSKYNTASAMESRRAEYERTVAPVDKEIEDSKNYIFNYIDSYPELVIFPMDYFNEYSLNKCTEYVRSHRAESFKEAINLMEQELHYMRMEAAQNAMLNSQLMMIVQQQSILSTARTNTMLNAMNLMR